MTTTNGSAVLEPTPIFDSVMQDQGVELMPVPATPTHAEFMAASGYNEWLAGVLDQTEQYERPAKHTSDKSEVNPMGTHPVRPVPTKRKGGKR
jgi:hypothetical protein